MTPAESHVPGWNGACLGGGMPEPLVSFHRRKQNSITYTSPPEYKDQLGGAENCSLIHLLTPKTDKVLVSKAECTHACMQHTDW